MSRSPVHRETENGPSRAPLSKGWAKGALLSLVQLSINDVLTTETSQIQPPTKVEGGLSEPKISLRENAWWVESWGTRLARET